MRLRSCLPPLLLLPACQMLAGSETRSIVHDIHSFSEPNRVRVTHASIDLLLDFEQHRARGTVEMAARTVVVFGVAAQDAAQVGIVPGERSGQDTLDECSRSRVRRTGSPKSLR